MTDLERVLQGLDCISGFGHCLQSEAFAGGICAYCMKEIAKKAKKLLKEQEWISVTDRMPEEHETIFAKFKGTEKWSPAMFAQSSDDVRVVVVFADGTRRVSHSHTIDGKWECEKSPVKRTVTHWMPNPGLPEEGR